MERFIELGLFRKVGYIFAWDEFNTPSFITLDGEIML